MTIQLYGRFDGWWSHSVVSRGIVEGLLENGVRGLRVWNAAGRFDAPAQYEGLHSRAVVGYDAEAAIGFYVGGYAPMMTTWLTGHAVKGALLIAESETLPTEWGAAARELTRLFVPSHWVKTAFEDVRVPNGRISVLPHGVAREFAKALPVAEPADHIRLLHVAGAASYLERKGTPQLLTAFQRVVEGGLNATLTLRTPVADGFPIVELLEQLSPATRACVRVDATPAEPPAAMAALIAKHDLVVQPSRAEAFGIVPCEARALGVPVALTACSGHAAHVEPDDILIPSTESGPIVVNGIPAGGRAPKVATSTIVKLLRALPHKLPAAQEAARARARSGYAARMSWRNATKLLADWLEYQQRRVRRAGRGGIQLGEV